jgi:hypothetical protein
MEQRGTAAIVARARSLDGRSATSNKRFLKLATTHSDKFK